MARERRAAEECRGMKRAGELLCGHTHRGREDDGAAGNWKLEERRLPGLELDRRKIWTGLHYPKRGPDEKINLIN